MSLSSESIQKKEFHIVFKGYKPEEVDKFLDMLALEFDGMNKKIRDLEERVDSIQFEGDTESSKMKKVIQEALISAHRMAEEIKQKAKTEAEEMISRKKIEQEQELKGLHDEKASLEASISRLKDEYSGFKDQVSRFADEFKKKMMGIGDSRLLDALKDAGSEDYESTPEASSSPSEIPEEEATSQNSEDENTGPEEEVLYKHASKEEEEEKEDIGANDLKDLAALTDEMLEKLDRKEDEEGSNPETETGKSRKQTKDDGGEEKRSRKKIDIANPDIINDFFKTDEG